MSLSISEEEELELLQLRKKKAQFQEQQSSRPVQVAPGFPEASAPSVPSVELTGPEFSRPIESTTSRMLRDYSEQLGIPEEDISLRSGLPGGTLDAAGKQFLVGLSTDIPEEQQRFVEQYYPGSKVGISDGKVAFVTPEGTFHMIEPRGEGIAPKVVRMAGAGLPATAGALATGATGLATKHPGLAMGAGAGAAELVREGAQGLMGTQAETPAQYGTRAAVTGALELIPGAASLVSRWGKSKSPSVLDILPSESQELSQLIDELALMGPDGLTLPKLMNAQKTDHPVVGRMFDQMRSYSEEAQRALTEQLNQLVAASKEVSPGTGIPDVSADEIMQEVAGSAYKEKRADLVPEVVTEEAGKRAGEAFTTGIGVRKAAMKEGYSRLDKMIEGWTSRQAPDANGISSVATPTFNVSGAKTAAADRGAAPLWVMGADEQADFLKATGGPEGTVDVQQVLGHIDALADPQAKLRAINNTLERIDPWQEYEAVKQLRSRVGKILDQPSIRKAESSVDLGQAKQLYRELTGSMQNADNIRGMPRAAAEQFAKNNKEVNSLALKYYDTFDLESVKALYSSKDAQAPSKFINDLANQPEKFPTAAAQLIEETVQTAPELKDRLRQDLKDSIMSSTDPLAVLNSWKSGPNRDTGALKWVFGSNREVDNAFATAQHLRQIEQSLGSKAAKSQDVYIGFAKDYLAEQAKTSPKGVADPGERTERLVNSFVRQAGQKGFPPSIARRTLRTAVLDEAMEGTVKMNTKGQPFVDPQVLAKKVDDLKTTGRWDKILTERDQKALDALVLFARKNNGRMDGGTALTVAATVGRLTNPSTAVQTYGQIQWHRYLARIFTETELNPTILFPEKLSKAGGRLGDSALGRMTSKMFNAFGPPAKLAAKTAGRTYAHGGIAPAVSAGLAPGGEQTLPPEMEIPPSRQDQTPSQYPTP